MKKTASSKDLILIIFLHSFEDRRIFAKKR
jgi:hypothetical protein